jgi:hypothetical protein
MPKAEPDPPKHDGHGAHDRCPPARGNGQRNESDQHQLQLVPIAPQVNLQNVNVLSGGDVEQDANNANTGQASQQQNTLGGGGGGLLPIV